MLGLIFRMSWYSAYFSPAPKADTLAHRTAIFVERLLSALHQRSPELVDHRLALGVQLGFGALENNLADLRFDFLEILVGLPLGDLAALVLHTNLLWRFG